MHSIKPKKTLVEQTYEILLEAICSGELPPGERLTQDDIAARLNVSRQPVNSAISILKANHFVEDTGRRGVVVSAIDPDQFQSIYEFRAVVEPLAVRLAGERMPDDAKPDAEAILRRGQEALNTGSTKQLLQADVDFHEMIYRWSCNHSIASSMRVNWQHMRRSMAEVLRDPSSAVSSWQDHQAIIEKLFSGATDLAAAEMTEHIVRAQKKMMAKLPSHR
jgi:DNA-binding GntR family transcriptional regulator